MFTRRELAVFLDGFLKDVAALGARVPSGPPMLERHPIPSRKAARTLEVSKAYREKTLPFATCGNARATDGLTIGLAGLR